MELNPEQISEEGKKYCTGLVPMIRDWIERIWSRWKGVIVGSLEDFLFDIREVIRVSD